MKRAIKIRFLTSTFLVVGTSAATSAALDLQGSDRLADMTRSIIQACSLSSINYAVKSSSNAEAALLAGSQLVAPMSRFLGDGICSATSLGKASGVASAIDAVVIAANAASVATCGGIRPSGGITVGDGTYSFANWRDVLRVLFTGVQHDGTTDCNAPVRQALANGWLSLFDGACSGSCTSLQRLWRAGDRSDTTSTFLSLMALPSITANPAVFCNGTELEDNDPVRRPCTSDEQVCGKGGNLGLVVPIVSADFLAQADAFPTTPCTSTMMFAQVADLPGGLYDRCPNGDIPVFGNLCLVPVDASGNPGCLATKNTKPAFIFDNTPVDGVTPSRADGRVYNLHLHKPDGSYHLDPNVQPARQMSRAFHRIHSKTPTIGGGVACTERDATKQIGCLTQASKCSLGFAGLQAETVSGVAGLNLNGIAPTATNIQNFVSRVAPIYPLSQIVYLNTLSGFNDLAGLDQDQSTLATCFFTQPVVEAAATSAGLVTLGKAPFCQDFNELAICGAPRNDNACGVSFNICPGIDSIDVSPLETRVGTTIPLHSAASDIDNAPQPLTYSWSATLGSIDTPDQPNAIYTCTTAGTATITLTITDGDCPDSRTVPVTCTP